MDRLEIITGVGDIINQDSKAEIPPQPSLGLVAGVFIT